jgi:antitoxin VapB
MALSIKDPEADQLAREVAALSGKTITQAIVDALKEQLLRERRKLATSQILNEQLVGEIRALSKHCSKLKRLNNLSDDEILDYNEFGYLADGS